MTNADVPNNNVGDLINRRAAIDAFEKELTVGESKGNYVTICSAVCYEGAKQILEGLPSIDAVEIVRCKDCKHRHHSVECPCQSYDRFYSWMPADDWFCKKGERKEE